MTNSLSSVSPADGYAGDVTPQQAWQWVQAGQAVLVDVRSDVPGGAGAVLLCRSGVRSIAAARRATELGITAYNILEGFEGDADAQGQRGKKGGWRFHGLPWKQG